MHVLVPVLCLTGIAALPVTERRPAEPPPFRTILSAPWGAGAGAFGLEPDGARLGPSALAVAGERLYILDRVNARVQVFDLEGRLLEMRAVGSRSVDMLAVDARGMALVLDAFVRREVRVLAPGKEPRILSLPERGRAMPSEVFAARDAVLVEWQHGAVSALPCRGIAPLFAIPRGADSGGGLPGRPTPGGWVRAGRSGTGIDLALGRGATRRFETIPIPVPDGVEAILGLGADARGRLLVAAWPWNAPERRVHIWLLTPQGRELMSFAVPDGSIGDLYTRLVLAPEGRLFQLRTSVEGVEVREWLWRGAPAPATRRGGER